MAISEKEGLAPCEKPDGEFLQEERDRILSPGVCDRGEAWRLSRMLRKKMDTIPGQAWHKWKWDQEDRTNWVAYLALQLDHCVLDAALLGFEKQHFYEIYELKAELHETDWSTASLEDILRFDIRAWTSDYHEIKATWRSMNVCDRIMLAPLLWLGWGLIKGFTSHQKWQLKKLTRG